MSADPQAPEYKEAADRRVGAHKPQPVPALRARAGITGQNVRYVLAFSLIARNVPGVKNSWSHTSIDVRMSKGNGSWFGSTGLYTGGSVFR
jgi:hypothetical protein